MRYQPGDVACGIADITRHRMIGRLKKSKDIVAISDHQKRQLLPNVKHDEDQQATQEYDAESGIRVGQVEHGEPR